MNLRALSALAGAASSLAAGFAMAETVIVITRADCAALVAHRPAPGVAYTPGVDVHGKPVVPADLGGAPQIALPDMVEIPITVELAPRFGIPATPDLYKAEAEIGRARVSLRDGRAWFNGQPLTSEEEHALARLCQRQGIQPR